MREPASHFSPEEWEARLELACCYRAVEHMGWHKDSIHNHISLRVAGPDDHFLINAFGLMYQEITASNLLKVDIQGNKLSDSPYPLSMPGFVVHAAVHRARPDVKCVIHTHSAPGMAVCAQKQGLLPIHLSSITLSESIAYYDLQGMVDQVDECELIGKALGDKHVLMMRNHGPLVCADTVGKAFSLMWRVENACETQVLALAGGVELNIPDENVIKRTAKQFAANFAAPERMLMSQGNAPPPTDLAWAAMRRRMEKLYPDFAT